MNESAKRRTISVTGLGYVGLPVAVAFARAGFDVTGFDVDEARLADIRGGRDRTGEIAPGELETVSLRLTADPADLARADFHIVTVPTPIDDANAPDLGPLAAASRTLGGRLTTGDIVIYESTVFPGATEDVCVPILEARSGLTHGKDFTVGYSPERINPGDATHRFETIDKVVSAADPATLDIVAATYGAVVTAGIHRAPSIRTAEAAKVLENTQRDLNIALMNEFAKICHVLDIDTRDVLAAAGTKWNFLPFGPGLVGGHCVGVDPYYLTHRALEAGYDPRVILAGRRINDDMADYIAEHALRLAGGGAPSVIVLGASFKENVPDPRNSKAIDVARAIEAAGAALQVCDPVVDADAIAGAGIVLTPPDDLAPADVVVLAVAHQAFRDGGWGLIDHLLAPDGSRVVVDVPGVLAREDIPDDVVLWRL